MKRLRNQDVTLETFKHDVKHKPLPLDMIGAAMHLNLHQTYKDRKYNHEESSDVTETNPEDNQTGNWRGI